MLVLLSESVEEEKDEAVVLLSAAAGERGKRPVAAKVEDGTEDMFGHWVPTFVVCIFSLFISS